MYLFNLFIYLFFYIRETLFYNTDFRILFYNLYRVLSSGFYLSYMYNIVLQIFAKFLTNIVFG